MEGTSTPTRLRNPKNLRTKEQYYELEANRGYIADGWKIATYREGSQTFDEPKWGYLTSTTIFLNRKKSRC